jgi:nitrite reductase/ring-hydroxylating ferredoxin subunit
MMKLCQLSDMTDPGAAGFQVGAGDWPLRGLVTLHAGVVRAYRNRCPHAGHALDLIPNRFLTADGEQIVCSSHAARFRPQDGRCVSGPCIGQSLQPIPVQVEDGWVVLAPTVNLQDYAD